MSEAGLRREKRNQVEEFVRNSLYPGEVLCRPLDDDDVEAISKSFSFAVYQLNKATLELVVAIKERFTFKK